MTTQQRISRAASAMGRVGGRAGRGAAKARTPEQARKAGLASAETRKMRQMLAESHRRQFNGEDYQAATFDMWQGHTLTEDQLKEIQSAPDPGCECGFCATADWQG